MFSQCFLLGFLLFWDMGLILCLLFICFETEIDSLEEGIRRYNPLYGEGGGVESHGVREKNSALSA